jgi:hypothetical protein
LPSSLAKSGKEKKQDYSKKNKAESYEPTLDEILSGLGLDSNGRQVKSSRGRSNSEHPAKTTGKPPVKKPATLTSLNPTTLNLLLENERKSNTELTFAID